MSTTASPRRRPGLGSSSPRHSAEPIAQRIAKLRAGRGGGGWPTLVASTDGLDVEFVTRPDLIDFPKASHKLWGRPCKKGTTPERARSRWRPSKPSAIRSRPLFVAPSSLFTFWPAFTHDDEVRVIGPQFFA